MPDTPWADCKVAYGVDDEAALWRWYDRTKAAELPAGWSLDETDCSGARCVVVFRVEGLPAVEDGKAVARIVRRVGRLRRRANG
jgi:hypothetical protein